MQDIILTKQTYQSIVSEILDGVKILIEESQETDLLKNEWLTAKEVQTLLKITPTTLWNYDNRGITNPQKIGNRKRYHRPKIIALLQKKVSKKVS